MTVACKALGGMHIHANTMSNTMRGLCHTASVHILWDMTVAGKQRQEVYEWRTKLLVHAIRKLGSSHISSEDVCVHEDVSRLSVV